MNADVELQSRFQIDGNYKLIEATHNMTFKTVLDVGFGNGAASNYFAMNKKTVVAIDRDIKHRDAPLSKMRSLGINIEESSFEDFVSD